MGREGVDDFAYSKIGTYWTSSGDSVESFHVFYCHLHVGTMRSLAVHTTTHMRTRALIHTIPARTVQC